MICRVLGLELTFHIARLLVGSMLEASMNGNRLIPNEPRVASTARELTRKAAVRRAVTLSSVVITALRPDGALLAVLTLDALAVQRVPSVEDLDFLRDMRRMTR